ncbi:AMP-dependent synthetase/ligase [Capillimicrobium parvum]|uniref:Acyl-CoA synthetase n=1 Tax=Capillimicrobium parvum TaxID=2884022 RepID=A0A9E6XXM9_9ACTN|nr:long-chain fatty acid--CoA ligase [Capillimicrobium parvum]UGS36273.1 Long-chain-fatty-acid--CoA ligase FadD15 [Capillimicrobium parvum]
MSRGETVTHERAIERSLHAGTLGQMFLAAAERDGVALRFPRDGAIHEWTHRQLGLRARRLAAGLVGLGIAPGDRVALFSETRPEWTLADAAILCAGATVVPIYHTSAPGEAEHVLAHSGARAVIVENAAQLAKVEEIRANCPDLEHVAVIDPVPGAMSIAELAERGADADGALIAGIQASIAPDDVATIVYTSGTTGPPKGCMLTHANLLATMDAYERQLDLSGDVVIFLFLPLAHALARVTELVALDVGGTLAFWSGDAARLIDDLAETRPTHVPSVPRVFEKVHTRALAKGDDGGRLTKTLFDWALATGRTYRRAERRGRVNPLLRARHAAADRLVLAKIRALFGDRIELALTGAAPIAREVLEFFDACGVLVVEGYGMTETCAAATLNTPAEFRFGTVGRALPGTGVRIAEDGEILLSGPNVFAGYYRNPEATAETMDGEWLRTGDLGALEDGYLRITGRKKDLIITSSGKNVSPANIEAALRESRWISQAIVYGDDRPYLVALLTLDMEEAPALAEAAGIPFDAAAIHRDPKVHELVQADVDAANARFARIEQVKRFEVLDHDLTHEAGELTPTQKLKRNVVNERYRDRLEALYDPS